jgi:hypothetical protein
VYASSRRTRRSGFEVVRRAPVGLRDDTNAESLRLEHAADDGHPEARMIDVRVAGHEDQVALIPAERVHLLARHRQERRGRQAMRPVLSVTEKIGRFEVGG